MKVERILRRGIALTMLMLACTASPTWASAGAPDPAFGSHGIASLDLTLGKTFVTSPGNAVLLPNSETVLPITRTDYRFRKGEVTGIRAQSVTLHWLSSNGARVRTSPSIALPKDVPYVTLSQLADGHLLLVGVRTTSTFVAKSFYIVRLTDAGIPDGMAATTAVPLSKIAHVTSALVSTDGITTSVAPNGRAFVQVRQRIIKKVHGYSQVSGYGPTVIAAIDPTVGVAQSFAGGGLIVAPASDARTSVSVAMQPDNSGRLLTIVRTYRNGIGGTTQDVRLTRYSADGSVDTSFAGGAIDLDAGTVDTAYSSPSLSLLTGGDVLVRLDENTDANGQTSNGIELRRYLSTGQLATNFGTGGRATLVLQTSKSSGNGSSSSSDLSDIGSGPPVFEQPDGKLVVGVTQSYRYVGAGRAVPAGDVLRTTATGALDTTYEQHGFARFDVPTPESTSSALVGVDAQGHAIGFVHGYHDDYPSAGSGSRDWIMRLLGGDEPAPTTTATLNVDRRSSCGKSDATSCFDADGTVHITGTLSAGGHPLAGGYVVVRLTRPKSAASQDYAPALPLGRSGNDGRFSIAVPRASIMPGAWIATGRVLATPNSQRDDVVAPTRFTLGPRSDIALLHTLQKSEALSAALSDIVSDTVDYDDEGDVATVQCATLDICFGASPKLRKLVSATAHPAPGHAGVILGKPDHYTIVTRANTTKFRLEFVLIETPDDLVLTCRGDAAARKRWCPHGTWNSSFNDEFATAGLDGTPFDYSSKSR